MTQPAAFFGLPWKREVDSECAMKIGDFILATARAGIPTAKQGVIGNLVWVGRSGMIAQAKAILAKTPGLYHLQFDSDAYPITDPLVVWSVLRQRFKQGVGIVIAGVHSLARDETGQVGFVKEWNEHPSSDGDRWGFRVQSGSFTMVAFNPDLLAKLEPDGTWKPLNGPAIPIYTWTDREHTEDVRMILRAEELGFPTWVDKRLICEHGKGYRVPGYGVLADESVPGDTVPEEE